MRKKYSGDAVIEPNDPENERAAADYIVKLALERRRTKYVHCALTHRVITSREVALTNPWDGTWIHEAVASWIGHCTADELTEDEDGFIVRGKEPVAYVEVN